MIHATKRLGHVTERGAVALYDAASPSIPTDLPIGTWVELTVGTSEVRELARPETALADTYIVAAAHKLTPYLPAPVEAEGQAWANSPGIDDPSLTDLTQLPFVTIDEETSKDLDQAIVVEPTATGFTVWYAIADAAHYVRPGMALWDEALARGSTAYLPGLVVPMLPRILSEDIISLNEGVDRRAVVFEMTLSSDGRCSGTVMHRARVHCRCKTWFDAVQRYYDGGPCPSDDPAVAASLDHLQTIGEMRIRLAEERSMVSYRRRPLDIHLPSNTDARFVALTAPRNAVERYNEQISILANVEGAILLANAQDPDVQAIYRVHGAPPDAAIVRLRRQLAAFARAHSLPKDIWEWDGKAPLATWLEELPNGGRDGQLARAVHRMALMTNKRSTFQAEPDKHHGVGAPIYSRFTAPMREVVGIFVHKELCEHLGWASPNAPADDERIRKTVINISHATRTRQSKLDRQMNRIVIDQLFESELDRPQSERTAYEALVLGMSKDKVHVQLDIAPLDVKLYVSHVEAQLSKELHVDPSEIALRDKDGTAVVAIGDAITVTALSLDTERDRWKFHVEKVS
ncbi:MAG: ribonuclease R [Myxococcota bacterium]